MKILPVISFLLFVANGLPQLVHIEKPSQTKSGTKEPTAKQQTNQSTSTNNSALSKGERCVRDLQIFSESSIEPLQQFDKFIEDVCLTNLDLRVPNGVKIASCFHTGYFLMRTLRPLAVQIGKKTEGARDKFDIYIDDFCEKYEEVMPLRTEFIQKISQIQEQDDFTNTCYKHLEENPNLNSWFDPIDAISSITQQEVCDLHFKLFDSLREKQRSSLSEFVSFSYLSSLDLFLNAHMQQDYENCVNMDVIEQPNQWVTSFVTSHPALQIWSPEARLNIAANSAAEIEQICADKATCSATGQCEACNGCSAGITRVFKTFEIYLNTMFADKFRDYSEIMFKKLHEASLAIESN